MKYIVIGILVFLGGCSLCNPPDACVNNVIPKSIKSLPNAEVSAYVGALTETVLFSDSDTNGSYCQLRKWYEDRMFSRRLSSRMLAILIIVLGASLPIVVILDNVFSNQKFWIAFLGAAIVVAQGFGQVFQYDKSWEGYTLAKLKLEGSHREWQAKMVNTSMSENGLEDAQRATKLFSDSVSNIVLTESEGFFEIATDAMKKIAESAEAPSVQPLKHWPPQDQTKTR